nr:MAG TPA: hypothetical protein [Caudoviricetes sp.]
MERGFITRWTSPTRRSRPPSTRTRSPLRRP